MTIRFFILQAQYRSTLDFSNEALQAAEKGYERLMKAMKTLSKLKASEKSSVDISDIEPRCKAAMDDDLNTADAISAVFELVTAINTAVKDGASRAFAQKSLDTLMELANVLGLLQQEFEEEVVIDDELQALIDERQEARKAKNFARADEIRDELKARGLILKDTPQGVQVIKA